MHTMLGNLQPGPSIISTSTLVIQSAAAGVLCIKSKGIAIANVSTNSNILSLTVEIVTALVLVTKEDLTGV